MITTSLPLDNGWYKIEAGAGQRFQRLEGDSWRFLWMRVLDGQIISAMGSEYEASPPIARPFQQRVESLLIKWRKSFIRPTRGSIA